MTEQVVIQVVVDLNGPTLTPQQVAQGVSDSLNTNLGPAWTANFQAQTVVLGSLV